MTAALVLAKRGHRVPLFDSKKKFGGGQLNLAVKFLENRNFMKPCVITG
ncbi:MAG: hypothetical protein Ct9H90mP8_1270 [Pseudomonadota bacterium]|nr:MAG: hypothetical protein Ct9H90mP8_1270 [Pseudomonadota bacterium]